MSRPSPRASVPASRQQKSLRRAAARAGALLQAAGAELSARAGAPDPRRDPGGPPAEGGPVPILEQYAHQAPSAQQAADIFAGEWSSALPPAAGVHAGPVGLFDDDRIRVGAGHLGGVGGMRVLELGPLEGGHSWMLAGLGAAEVVAVESNSRAYLKCLIAKEILGTPNVSFLFGDCLRYLQEQAGRFDLVLASGILYHMQEPVELLRQIAAHTDRLILWTHYYDPGVLTATHPQTRLFTGEVVELGGVGGGPVRGHRHTYQEGLDSQAFTGSGSTWSYWLERDAILDTLAALGFRERRIDFDHPHHVNGPSFLVTAWR